MALVVTSCHSTRIQRLTACKALSVLATLFFLSYTKNSKNFWIKVYSIACFKHHTFFIFLFFFSIISGLLSFLDLLAILSYTTRCLSRTSSTTGVAYNYKPYYYKRWIGILIRRLHLLIVCFAISLLGAVVRDLAHL